MKSTSAPEAIAALRDPACYPHPAEPVELIETHISWVFLAGEYAYKVKKPVDLGFLDFSTLQARRFYCEEELRLNRRTAPELYLGVVPITAGAAGPRLGGAGEAIEYALKMRRFPQEAHAVLAPRTKGGYIVSVRVPAGSRTSAEAFCRQFPSGGGRSGAAGIDDLPEVRMEEF